MPSSFLINPQVELVIVKASCWILLAVLFSLGGVYLLRFRKTKVRKVLIIGLSLIVFSPFLYYLMIKIELRFLARPLEKFWSSN